MTYQPLPSSLKIKDSSIHGQGLFATENIPIDTDLGVSHIEVVHKNLEAEIIRTPLGGFINHSDTPNCFINENIHYHDGQQRELYTTRPIKKGEEITVFYTKGYDDILR